MFKSNSQFSKSVMLAATVGFLAVMQGAPVQAGSDSKGSFEPAPMTQNSWYLEGRIGGALSDETDGKMVSPNVGAANGSIVTETDGGFGFTAAVGKYFMPRWRGEVEWAHGSTDDIKIDYSGAPLNPFSPQTLSANGDITVDTVMVNVLRSWNRTIFGRLRPYNGIGIGVTRIDVDNVAPTGSRFIVDDTDTVFTAAYHSGFDWEVSERTSLTFRVSTTYTAEADFSARDTTGAGGIMSVNGDSEFSTAISAGVRIKLQ